MISGPMLDHFLPHVKRAFAQASVDEAARIILALVSDHPMRRDLVARFQDWEELMRDSEMGLPGIFDRNAPGSRNSINRKEGDELLKSFVRSVISEVWKP